MEYLIEEDGVVYHNKKISENIEIKTVYQNIETQEIKADIEFDTMFGQKKKRVARSQYLNKKGLLKLQKDGVDVINENCNDLINYLLQSEKLAEKKLIHSELGFGKYDSKDIYKLYRAVGIESDYEGIYQIYPHGDKAKYMKMIEKEVLGNSRLELAWICGLSAVILGYIGEKVQADTLIIHLFGNSTTGKSTALKLAISSFSAPDTKKESLLGTYNGTENAIFSKLRGLNGVPYALDEISMSDNDKFSKFIYKLANGTDKERLDKNSEIKNKGTWMTTMLSNGEKSILNCSDKNAGIQVRVLEFDNITWTNSFKNAEEINRVINENYGHIGLEFAKLIMKIEKEELVKEFQEIKKTFAIKLRENIDSDNMLERRASKYAIILLTAELVEKLIGKKLDICNIEKLLINVERNSIKNRNFKATVIQYIKQYITRNSNKFIDDEKENINTGQILGIIKNNKGSKELQIDRISFENMIKEGNFEDSNVVLKELKSEGLLNCEADRYTRKRKNSFGILTEYIVIKIN